MTTFGGTRRTVVVVEPDEVTREWLRAVLSRPSYRVIDVSSIENVPELALGDIAILVLGPTTVDGATIERAGLMTRARPGLGALLVVDHPPSSLLRTALRAGVSDAVERHEVDAELAKSVDDLWHRLERGAASASAAAKGARVPAAQVTTVFSPKGGVGKSVVAVNLAVAFARTATRPVAILDLDLQFGDIAVMLRLQPVHTILEAAAAGDLLDAVLMDSLLARHEASNVLVLAAPTTPSAADQIRSKDMLRILGVLREMCGHVVIDTPPHLSEVVLQAVSESDDIAFVVGMDVPSVKNARLGLQAFELLQLPLDKVVLVLNRADSKVHLAVRDVERSLQLKVDITLPSDALVPQSVNEGVPALLASPRSKFVGRIDALAKMLTARVEARNESRPG